MAGQVKLALLEGEVLRVEEGHPVLRDRQENMSLSSILSLTMKFTDLFVFLGRAWSSR